MDYEMSVMRALEEVYPDTQQFGCLFHLHQNMIKHIAAEQMTDDYRNDPIFAMQARMIVSIAFVPILSVNRAFRELSDYVDRRLDPILKWFSRYYLHGLNAHFETLMKSFLELRSSDTWDWQLPSTNVSDRTVER